MIKVFLVSVDTCGTASLFPALLCVALAGFAVWCERVCLLLAVARQKINYQASAFYQSREKLFPRPIVSEQQQFHRQDFPTKSCNNNFNFSRNFMLP